MLSLSFLSFCLPCVPRPVFVSELHVPAFPESVMFPYQVCVYMMLGFLFYFDSALLPVSHYV